LDECNGINVTDGRYQYHVRKLDQVDGTSDYCDDEDNNSVVINWDYILGCYSGDVTGSKVIDSLNYELDDNCVIESSTDSPTV